jgi:hypothetical protein
VLADEEREAELKKEKFIKEKEAKEKKKLKSEEFKRKRKETETEPSKKRKLASSFASEHRNADRSRRPIGLIDALPVHHGKGRTSCGEEVCKNRYNENCHLREVDKKVTIAAAMSYRQLLCTQAFCKYSKNCLMNGEYGSTRKLYAILYQCLPRFISFFNQCVGELGTVKKLLAVREEKTWGMYGFVPPTQELAYLYCQDLLKSGISPVDLNLCTLCDKKVAEHPPKTCSLVNEEFKQLSSRKRTEWEESYKNRDLAFDRSPKKIATILRKQV